MALRSASTASVSPSITMSREKKRASPSSRPLTMEIRRGSGPRTAAPHSGTASRPYGVSRGRSGSGRMMIRSCRCLLRSALPIPPPSRVKVMTWIKLTAGRRWRIRALPDRAVAERAPREPEERGRGAAVLPAFKRTQRPRDFSQETISLVMKNEQGDDRAENGRAVPAPAGRGRTHANSGSGTPLRGRKVSLRAARCPPPRQPTPRRLHEYFDDRDDCGSKCHFCGNLTQVMNGSLRMFPLALWS